MSKIIKLKQFDFELFGLDFRCKKRPDAKMIQNAKMQILV